MEGVNALRSGNASRAGAAKHTACGDRECGTDQFVKQREARSDELHKCKRTVPCTEFTGKHRAALRLVLKVRERVTGHA